MPQPSIGRRSSWDHFRENVSSLITEALQILLSKTNLAEREKPLNRILRLCFRSANHKLGLEYFPALDAENDTDDVEHEGSKPDLSWSFYNDLADDPEDCERSFALECKRLGKPTPERWKFNEQYVVAGLLRFFNEEKGYSKGCGFGAMVGYVQNMEFDEILEQINLNIAASKTSIPRLFAPSNGWQSHGVSHLEHCFVRSFLLPIFFLDHFWVDLRDRYVSSPGNTSMDVTVHQETHHIGNEVSIAAMLKNAATKQGATTQETEANVTQLELPSDQPD